MDRSGTGRLQPPGQLRAAAHRVHDEVCGELVTGLGPHPADVGHAVISTCDEPGDRHPAAYFKSGFRLRRAGQDLLDGRAPGVDGDKALVAFARRAVGDRGRHQLQRIDRDGRRLP